MKTILITGAAGFIGSHATERFLQEGYRVIALDNFDDFYSYTIKIQNLIAATKQKPIPLSSDKEKDLTMLANHLQSNSIELVVGDIRDEGLLDRLFAKNTLTGVLHLAALAGVRPSIERPLEYTSVNVHGSMCLWEACRKHGVKKFLCASSSSVYGNNEKVPFAEEDVVDFAISPYAATKKSAEVLSHVYHRLYKLDIVQLRFFTVYGPRQRPDLAIHKFTKKIRAGEAIPFFGDGETYRDYTFVQDIMDGVFKSWEYLLEHETVYEIINLGESETISLNKMVATLEAALGMQAEKNYLPKQAGDVERTFANIDKAKMMLGYNPQTNFEQGIAAFVAWFRKNKA